jgi:hypothetical protein
MNTSTQTLPDGYAQSGEVNLKKDKRLAILLNLVALIVTALIFYLLPIFGTMLRSDTSNISVNISAGPIMLLIGLTVSILIVHELIHGFFSGCSAAVGRSLPCAHCMPTQARQTGISPSVNSRSLCLARW